MWKVALLLIACTLSGCADKRRAAFNVTGTWTGHLSNTSNTYSMHLSQATGSDHFSGTLTNPDSSGTVSGRASIGLMNYVGNSGVSGVFRDKFTATTYHGTFWTRRPQTTDPAGGRVVDFHKTQ